VIAEYYNIPDDIAGATLMAAGASSPELFSSIVSLFVTHSALGLGTVSRKISITQHVFSV
jgi:Ca2+/Na+ antiporter